MVNLSGEELLSSYMSLNPSLELHLTPEGAYLIEKGRMKGAVNNAAVDLFLLADGTRRARDAIEESGILRRTAGEKDLNGILDFLRTAEIKGDIRLHSFPLKTYNRITGSRDYYLPVHLMVELTYRCNLVCRHCYVGGLGSDGELDADDVISYLREFSRRGVRVVELTGGEPTVKQGFDRILKESFDLFDVVALLTNGYRMTEQTLDLLRGHRERCYVNVSLDSWRPEFHNAFRGRENAFENTAKTIARLAAEGINVRVAMSITRENMADLEKTFLLAMELGAETFSWSPVTPFGLGENIADLSLFGDPEFQKLSLYMVSRYGDRIALLEGEGGDMLSQLGNCGLGWKSAVMDPRGRLRPCPFLDSGRNSFGDLRRESIEDIFRKDVIFALRDIKAPDLDRCADCPLKLFCKGCVAKGIKMTRERPDCIWREGNDALQRILRFFEKKGQTDELPTSPGIWGSHLESEI